MRNCEKEGLPSGRVEGCKKRMKEGRRRRTDGGRAWWDRLREGRKDRSGETGRLTQSHS